MPYVIEYQCRRCKGPPLKKEPEGPCPNCQGFYRHIQTKRWTDEGEDGDALLAPIEDGEPISLADLMARKEDPAEKKRPTGSPGVDHVFGGGLPRRGAILISGQAGAGKTTWLWGLLHKVATEQKLRVLYISSEQEAQSLKDQLQRLPLRPTKRMIVLTERDARAIYRTIEKHHPHIMVLDSLHRVTGVTDEDDYGMASGSPGAVTQVAKEVRGRMWEMGVLAFLVAHMNLDGETKGGSDVQHEVDATLRIDCVIDRKDPRRLLSFEKVRFAPSDRRALLVMGEKGMEDRGPWEPEEGEGEEPTPRQKRAQEKAERVVNDAPPPARPPAERPRDEGRREGRGVVLPFKKKKDLPN